MRLSGKEGQKSLKITILKKDGNFKDDKNARMLIKNQITKFQSCIGCLACESQCKFNAIKLTNIGAGKEIVYQIDDSKCIGCLKCVTHFSGGFFMKKVLRTKKGVVENER